MLSNYLTAHNVQHIVIAATIPSTVYHGSPRSFTKLDPSLGVYWFTDSDDAAATQGHFIYRARLSMQNPYQWVIGDDEPDEPAFIAKLKQNGYDSCIAPSNVGITDYIVYDVSQVKLLSRRKYVAPPEVD